MKAVLLSIQPQWCRLIASGQKTIEVRKTRPKLDTPFKGYIYCTNRGRPLVLGDVFRGDWEMEYVQTYGWSREEADRLWGVMNGKIIGEFVCDQIKEITTVLRTELHPPICIVKCDGNAWDNYVLQLNACLTSKEICHYLGGLMKNGFAWHISSLEIYDTPKKLGDFQRACDHKEDCCSCRRFNRKEYSCISGLTRPPQSWCYVEPMG